MPPPDTNRSQVSPYSSAGVAATSDAILSTGTNRAQPSNERRTGTAAEPPSNNNKNYDVPDVYGNLTDASAVPPVQNRDEAPIGRVTTREDGLGRRRPSRASTVERKARMARRRSAGGPADYDIPDAFVNLDELTVSPVENPDENPLYRHHSLDQTRSREQRYSREEQRVRYDAEKAEVGGRPRAGDRPAPSSHVSRLATQIYTLSYLIFFAILGTLARLGLQALTTYPGTPVSFESIWPNFGGSVVMGFLAEDRMLFRFEWGMPTDEIQIRAARRHAEEAEEAEEAGENQADQELPGSSSSSGDNSTVIDLAAAKRAHLAAKKTIPLYIGLATGFCGSFTSFSAFIRDIFLALTNDIASSNVSRNGGYSFMAVLAVIILTISLSLGGLFLGAHIAIALEPFTPSLPFPLTRKVLDRAVVLLGWSCWIGAIILCALPPDRSGSPPETWRGRATFALVFAPLGCLLRFYASLYLNGRIASFPLGTFTVNTFGTLILGMSWDLAHVPLGGVVGCQVLQGVEDGFCGCLTTVSTWVTELAALRRRNAYLYGSASILTGSALLVAVMGGLKWTNGFSALQCVH